MAQLSAKQQEFVDMLMPAAVEASKRTGVDPRIIVAQAAQETGWGRSAPNNNYFGIKSHGKSGGANLMTHEYENGKRVNKVQSFRGYNSPEDSVSGYADFITRNPRYKSFRSASDIDSQLAELQRSGYATDPNYSRSVGSIAKSLSTPSLDAINKVSPKVSPPSLAYAPTPATPINRTQPQRQSLFGLLGGKAMQGMLGVGQNVGASFNRQVNKPGFKTNAVMSSLFGQRQPAAAVQAANNVAATPAQAISSQQSGQRVLMPGGDAVLKALFTRDVGDTNQHFADAVGRSQQQINTYRDNKRNGLI